MLGTSFFIHLAALLLCCWGAHEIIQLKKQKKILLRLLSNNPREKIFFLSPLDYTAFLARTFGLEFSGKPMLKWLTPRRIKGARLFDLLCSQQIQSFSFDSSPGEGVLNLVFAAKDSPASSLIDSLSEDLGIKVRGLSSDSITS